MGAQGTGPRHLSLGHFQNGRLMGYLISWAGIGRVREIIYSSDLTLDRAYRGTAAAGRLLITYLCPVQARRSIQCDDASPHTVS